MCHYNGNELKGIVLRNQLLKYKKERNENKEMKGSIRYDCNTNGEHVIYRIIMLVTGVNKTLNI